MNSDFFEEYRHVYRSWWNEKASTMDDEEREEFTDVSTPDSLVPLSSAELQEIREEFPYIQDDHATFLEKYGIGEVRFPDHDDIYPETFLFFGLDDMRSRVNSILQQATYELETLSDEYDDEFVPACEQVLKTVIANPFQFLPIFGPSNVYNFYYAVQGGKRDGIVSHWYHDYHSCELLDGSADLADFTAFGRSLIDDAKTGSHPL